MKHPEIDFIKTFLYLDSRADLTVIKGGHVTIKGKIGTDSILNLNGGMFIKEKNGDIEAGTLMRITNDANATIESSITDNVVISHQGAGTLYICGNVSEKAKIHFTGSGILKFEKYPPEGVLGTVLSRGKIIYNTPMANKNASNQTPSENKSAPTTSFSNDDVISNNNSVSKPEHPVGEKSSYAYIGLNLSHSKERIFAEGKPIARSNDNVSNNNSESTLPKAAQIDEKILEQLDADIIEARKSPEDKPQSPGMKP